MAEATGVSLSAINSWYHNDRYPAVNDAHAIARALRTTVDYLMSGTEASRHFDDPVIAEIIDYLEGLRPAELQQIYGMIKLARVIKLSDDVAGDYRLPEVQKGEERRA
jgi:transcriptional regulator with XRE-family HTH domain